MQSFCEMLTKPYCLQKRAAIDKCSHVLNQITLLSHHHTLACCYMMLDNPALSNAILILMTARLAF